MNPKRAIFFGLFIYLSAFVVVGTSRFAFGGLLIPGFVLPAITFPIVWVVFIPIVLLLSKWYFKEVEPTMGRGFMLGLMAIFTTSFIDIIGYTTLRLAEQDTAAYAGLYGDWHFWATLGWTVVLCTFAGWEFDKTFTKRNKGNSEITK